MNSVSIALFFFTVVHRYSKTPVENYVTDAIADAAPQMVISQTQYYISAAVLVFYVFSIVYGRLYTAMHSFSDCIVGTLLGVATWVLFVFYAEPLDKWVKNSGWIGSSQSALTVLL